MRYLQVLVIAAATTMFFSSFACAQGAADFPAKPVRIIVSSSPGGGSDLTARMFAQKLGENLKRPFLIDNRPGAGDTIGTGLAAKSAPDGYTILMASTSFTMAPAMVPNFLVDPVKDFAPISVTDKTPLLLVAHPSLPVTSVKELIALAKSKPGALDMGTTSGGINHLASSYFTTMANIKVSIIPYKGTGQSVVDVVAGQVPTLFGSFLTLLPHVKSGRLRGLAVTTAERSSALPDVPTIAESGLRGYDVGPWHGWLVPAGTPPAIVNKLNAELIKAMRSPDLAKKMTDDGAVIVNSTSEQFGELIAAEVSLWRKVVKELGMRLE